MPLLPFHYFLTESVVEEVPGVSAAAVAPALDEPIWQLSCFESLMLWSVFWHRFNPHLSSVRSKTGTAASLQFDSPRIVKP